MRESILNFNKQFSFQPEIANFEALTAKSSFVSVGMGGSNLAPRILKTFDPTLDITLWCDYGLPEVASSAEKLYIFSSYSGNTEETIDAFKRAKDEKLNIAVITAGGKLLELAVEGRVPHIKLPNEGIQPRMALGYSIKAFLKFIGREDELENISGLLGSLDPAALEERGKKLAADMKGSIPVVYTSSRNLSIAYNWKIKFNETGKIPAFCNVFPELNHNEMTGFDVSDSTFELGRNFYFLILKDQSDDPRIMKRMEVLAKLYKDRNLRTETIELGRGDAWHRIFSALVLADWTAFYTAEGYGVESEEVPMVEEFKKLI